MPVDLDGEICGRCWYFRDITENRKSELALRQAEGHWYASEMELVDLIDGSRTVVRVLGLDTEQVPPGRLFNPATFHVGN